MEPITSTDNAQVKLARSLHEAKGRARARAFLVEGLRLVEAATHSTEPQLALHSTAFAESGERAARLLAALGARGVPVRPVSERVLAHVSDTVTPQGIVAVVPLPEDQRVLRCAQENGPALDLILDAVQDPGNAGTLLRTAAAAGVGRVLSAEGTVDMFSPTVVRAAAGAHFQVRIGSVAWGALAGRGQVVLAEAGAPRRYWEIDWRIPSTLIVSNEARGATEQALRVATERVSIPMHTEIESLNAGVAGSIILYEALRQRTTSGVTV